jgi:hypothetical protein
MPPAIVGLPSEPKPMDRPNPLSKPHLVKLRRRGGSVSRTPKPPVSGYNPFGAESESDPVHERIQSWRPFDSSVNTGATFSGPCSRDSSPHDPPVTPVFGFGSSTNSDKHKGEGDDVSFNSVKGNDSSAAYKGTGQTGWGPFIFGNSTGKPSDNNLKDGKENKPVFVFGASESVSGPSNLPEKMQAWQPFNSGTEPKGSQDGAFVFGEKSKANSATQERITAENGTVKENGSSGLDRYFTFGGSTVPEGRDATKNIDSVGGKLEKTVHTSSSFVPKEKVENTNGKIPEENSDCMVNKKNEAGSFVPGSYAGPASMLPEEMKKLNLQNAKASDCIENGDADVLPEKIERLNLGSGSGNLETKPPVFIFGTKVNESTGSRQTSSESTHSEQFVFGSSANISCSNMKNISTSNEQESYTPGAFSFNFQDWQTETNIPETTLPDGMKKLEIGARKTAGLKDKKGKRKTIRLGKHKTAQPCVPSLVSEYSDRASSSEKNNQVPVTEQLPGSPAGYSPMDCSPYRESDASDDVQTSASLEVEAEVELASAAGRLEIKEENLNKNEKPRSKEVDDKEDKDEGDESKLRSTFAAFNAGRKEEAGEGMDYVQSSSVNVETGNTVSGSDFRFSASTSSQGPVPIIRRHFRRKHRVMRGSVESTVDQVGSSSVQPSSQWSNASSSPVGMRVDFGKQESRSRTEAIGTSGLTGGMSSSAQEACEKWRMRCFT